jgi:hypothetical protein
MTFDVRSGRNQTNSFDSQGRTKRIGTIIAQITQEGSEMYCNEKKKKPGKKKWRCGHIHSLSPFHSILFIITLSIQDECSRVSH